MRVRGLAAIAILGLSFGAAYWAVLAAGQAQQQLAMEVQPTRS